MLEGTLRAISRLQGRSPGSRRDGGAGAAAPVTFPGSARGLGFGRRRCRRWNRDAARSRTCGPHLDPDAVPAPGATFGERGCLHTARGSRSEAHRRPGQAP